MEKDIAKEPFKIHYYFEDQNLHSISALNRNKAEKHFLDLITNVDKLCKTHSKIDVNASKEGGFQELYEIINQPVTASLITFVGTYFLTRKSKEERKSIKLANEEKELDIKIKKATALKDGVLTQEDIDEDDLHRKRMYYKIKLSVSHFYSEISKLKDLIKIGFSYKNKPEKIVFKEDFEKYFIDIDDKEFLHENASIEIISPVLSEKNENTSWYGEYKENFIKFKMADKYFKEEVNRGNYSFICGTSILCSLRETIKYDENGEIDGRPKYRVEHVYDSSDNINDFKDIKQTTSEIRKPKQKNLDL
ncbi:hypothetical protein AB9G22_09200 [Francisella philomiragia]|uniref:hypothetical protein n=1 Tax=Francisella philomiragia TaxID=28110 RepID=UPI003517CC6B